MGLRALLDFRMEVNSLKTVKSFVIFALIVGTTYGQKGSGGTPPDGWTPPSDWTPPSGGPSGGPGKGGNGGGNGPTTTAVIPDEKPTVPTACTDANAGRCECGDPAE